jgi:hypothetical protein
MKIHFLTSAHNSLSQRPLVELTERGHSVGGDWIELCNDVSIEGSAIRREHSCADTRGRATTRPPANLVGYGFATLCLDSAFP